jgi:hypothetical protein
MCSSPPVELDGIESHHPCVHHQIELEKRKVAMLNQKLEDISGRLNGSRQKMGGVNSAKEASQSVQKQIKVKCMIVKNKRNCKKNTLLPRLCIEAIMKLFKHQKPDLRTRVLHRYCSRVLFSLATYCL